MNLDQPLERVLYEVHEMERQRCIEELSDFRQLPLDFTPDYLNALSLESLRHVLMAAVLTVRKRRSA